MAIKSKVIFIFDVTILALLIISCANQLPPEGGEIDLIPPKILESFPPNGTTNYQENYFEIAFSEYVDKRSVQEAIFISPPIQHGLEYDWSGKSLTVTFQDTLKLNRTYTITIGTDVIDLNNRNKMAEPFTFAFSTGDQIDEGKISGKIYDKDATGVMVYAYLKREEIVNPTIKKPDYISQVGKNGKYTLLGLSDGEYNVYAIRDKFRDYLYQKDDDEYGVQYKRLILSTQKREISSVDFLLSIEDTIPPKVSNVYMRDRNHILVEFSEVIDSTKITASNFYLSDSTDHRIILPKYFFKGDARPNLFYLSISDSLKSGNEMFLVSQNIADKKSNHSIKEITSFAIKTDIDTIPPKLVKVKGTLPADKVDYDAPIISFNFDDGIDRSLIFQTITIEDEKGNQFPFEINFLDDALFDIQLKTRLKQRTDYTLNIDLSKFKDAAGNSADSLYKRKFSTASELDFSGVSGRVEYQEDSLNVFMVLEGVGTDKKIYKQKNYNQKSFNVTKILPGKYLLWSFKDTNNDSLYNSGTVKPFKFAEEFKFHPDTLNLRARWPVGDIIIKYDKN